MTRYTNVGWKRTYHQASFDPNGDQIARNTASTSLIGSDAAATSHAPYESSIDTPAESNRIRRKKSKVDSVDSEGKVVADSKAATIAVDGDKTSSSVTKSKRTKKVLAAKLKLKARGKTRIL